MAGLLNINKSGKQEKKDKKDKKEKKLNTSYVDVLTSANKFDLVVKDGINYANFDGIYIYKGNRVDWKQMRTLTITTTTAKINVLKITKEDVVPFVVKLANFLNLGGFSKTRKNSFEYKTQNFTLDDIARYLELDDKTKTEAEKTSRDKLTLRRIAGAFAKETSDFLVKFPSAAVILPIGKFGFVNSYLIPGLKIDDLKKIVFEVRNWENSWTLKTGMERKKVYRFSNNIINYVKMELGIDLSSSTEFEREDDEDYEVLSEFGN